MGEYCGILNRHCRALGKKGKHWMRCISQQSSWASAPTHDGRTIVHSPFEPLGWNAQQVAGARRPQSSRVAAQDLSGLPAHAPAALLPIVAYYPDQVDQRAPANRIMNQMRMPPQ